MNPIENTSNASIDRIERLAARCVRYCNDPRFNLDIDQQALDAWSDKEIDEVEQQMDSIGLIWDAQCEKTFPYWKGWLVTQTKEAERM